MNRKKLHAAAMALPALGVFLLLSPIIRLISANADDANVSAVVAYVFAVWIGLIVLTFCLARALARAEPRDTGEADASAAWEPGAGP